MELNCGENGIIDGCQLLHSAYVLKARSYLRSEKIREALETLESTFEAQVKQLDGEKAHPFLEQCLSMMGLLRKVTKNLVGAEECYSNMVKITEGYYGTSSEMLMTALKNLGAVQASQDKNAEA